MTSPVRQRIPGYEIREVIGRGSSGVVYRARQVDLDRDVALKILQPGLFDAEETRARFLREARLMGRLTHPNLLTLYDAGFVGETPYLVMELVGGGHLQDLLTRPEPLSESTVLALAHKVAEGLAVAHRAGIIHRDLKPENILLTEAGEPKIADFGLARTLEGSQTLRTVAGTILGTPGYVAPEVVKGEEAGPGADVYALGVILYEMLSGTQAYVGRVPFDIIMAQLEGRHDPLGVSRPGVSPALHDLVSRCMDRDPRRRPASAEALSRDLQRLMDIRTRGSRPTGSATSKVTAGRTSPRRRLASALIFGLFVAGGGLWFARRDAPLSPPGRTLSNHQGERSRTSPPQSTLAPSDLSVTVGSRKARLVLERALTAPLELSYWQGNREARTQVVIPPGRDRVTLAGLEPGTAYRGKLAAQGGSSLPFSFETLRNIPPGESARLAKSLVHRSDFSVQGSRVSAAWLQVSRASGKGTISVAHSPDGGQTWGPSSLVEGRLESWEDVSVVLLPGGDGWVTWRRWGRPGAFLRPFGAVGSLGKKVQIWSGRLASGPWNWRDGHGNWRIAALEEQEDGSSLLVHGPLEAPTETFIHAGPAVPRLLGAWRYQMVYWKGSFVLVGLGAREQDDDQSRMRGVFWCMRGAVTQPWVRATDADENIQAPEVTLQGNRLYIAYEERQTSSTRVRYIDLATREWSPAESPFPSVDSQVAPAVTTHGDEVYLVALNDPTDLRLEPASVDIRRRAPDGSWQPVAERTCGALEARGMHIAVAVDRILVVINSRIEGLLLLTVPLP